MRHILRTVALVSSLALASGLGLATPATAGAARCPANPVTTFVPPTSTDDPFGVTAGPDHATYVAHGAAIDKIMDGRITALPVPHASTADLGWIAWRGDGAPRVWFADRDATGGRLGTMSAAGAVSEVNVPGEGSTAAVPQAIVFGAHGRIWFTDYANSRIGRYTPSTGRFHFFGTPSADSGPTGMVLGPDGDLYYVERSVGRVARLDPRTGLSAEWTLHRGAFPNRLVEAAGQIWFTDLGTNHIGRITPTGHLVLYPVAGGPVGITAHGGYLYSALYSIGKLAQISPSGHLVRTWTLPHPGGVLQLAASNGFIWVADGFANHVYRVRISC